MGASADEKQVLTSSSDFSMLVTGCLWLVRGGVPYTHVSLDEDDLSIQTTGDAFATVQSARTAIGHTADGVIKIVQVDGKTWSYGASLYELADLCIAYGLVNCVNLDGGGSASTS